MKSIVSLSFGALMGVAMGQEVIDGYTVYSSEIFADGGLESQYKLFASKFSLEDAIDFCASYDMTLGRISNEDQFYRVAELIEESGMNDISTLRLWVGLYDEVNEGEKNTARFSYVDGYEDTSFFATYGSFPWGSGEPNNSGGHEGGVQMALNSAGYQWTDQVNSYQNWVLCRDDIARFALYTPETKVTFIEAVGYCYLEGGSLARIENSVENSIAVALALEQDSNVYNPFIGMYDPVGTLHTGNPDAFVYVDGTPKNGFFTDAATSPWDVGEPNDMDDKEDCVVLKFSDAGDYEGWNDVECALPSPYICRFDL